MAYEQPRVPIWREGNKLTDYIKELVRFLRSFTVAAWQADKLKDDEIKAIKALIESSVGGGGITVDAVYPVGSIYMSVNETSPAELFGGTWEQLQGRFLMGAGIPENNNVNAWGNLNTEGINMGIGEMGGAFQHVHELESGYAKISNIDGQSKNFGFARVDGVDNYELLIVADLQNVGLASSNGITYNNLATRLGGSTDNANLLPPYLVVYMWKRTA